MQESLYSLYLKKENVGSKGMYLFDFILPNCSIKWLHTSIFSQLCPLLCLLIAGIRLLTTCQYNGYRMASHYGFIRYLPVTHKVEHLLKCLLTILVSSFLNCIAIFFSIRLLVSPDFYEFFIYFDYKTFRNNTHRK